MSDSKKDPSYDELSDILRALAPRCSCCNKPARFKISYTQNDQWLQPKNFATPSCSQYCSREIISALLKKGRNRFDPPPGIIEANELTVRLVCIVERIEKNIKIEITDDKNLDDIEKRFSLLELD